MTHRNPLDQIKSADGEVMPLVIHPGPDGIVLDYLAGDVKIASLEQCGRFRLFSKTFDELMHAEAALIANLILQGEEKDCEKALALVSQNPDLLRYHVIATDPLGRRVKGTLLQIAAMGGDVDLREGIEEVKDRGMVERLIDVGNFSKEEVVEQLKCISSKEAQQENKARNQRVLAAIEKFGTGICDVKADKGMGFTAFQARCQPIIDGFERALLLDAKEITSSGYIFDPKILQQAVRWFEANVDKSFNGWWSRQSEVFWVNGFGKLQRKLSSRDAQVVNAGIGKLVCEGHTPLHTLKQVSSQLHFYDPASRLGIDFYLGYYDGQPRQGTSPLQGSRDIAKLISRKNSSIAKLVHCPNNQSLFKSCLVM